MAATTRVPLVRPFTDESFDIFLVVAAATPWRGRAGQGAHECPTSVHLPTEQLGRPGE
ncbi:MAG: hypothetical protein JWP01_1049 [Myxococcales bacterium]|nr:hypothetical protein [Myxococcales bacterium]